MSTFDNPEVEDAMSKVSSILGVSLDKRLQEEYQNGLHPRLLSYEKVEAADVSVPVIQKYLIGAQTYLNQPCNYYDIFRLCRHVILLQTLSRALGITTSKVKNIDQRLKRLTSAREYDDFEASLYEIVTASNYCSLENVDQIEFINESDVSSPDLFITTKHGEIYVECKKFDRSVDVSLGIRNIIREKVGVVIDELTRRKVSAVIELSFHEDPNSITGARIKTLALKSLESRTPILGEDITVNVSALPYIALDTYTLYPSPKYFWERYRFRERSEWFGIVLAMYARHARHVDALGLPEELVSTWLDDVEWECAVKWKITNEKILWQHKRLGYDLLFKGLEQLKSRSTNTILHAWFERDYSIGHRQNELLDFFTRIKTSARDIFAWIVFNETCFDVSFEGRFDLIENAHIVRGPGATFPKPMVTCVFTLPDERTSKLAEFGIGHDMPDVDELYKSRSE
jgi:hypothetical protein